MNFNEANINNQLNQLNHELIMACDVAMNDVLLNRPFIDYNNYILDVIESLTVITENELLVYVFYNIHILNAMNTYLTHNNMPERNDMVSLVYAYRRLYARNYVANNRERVIVRQV